MRRWLVLNQEVNLVKIAFFSMLKFTTITNKNYALLKLEINPHVR